MDWGEIIRRLREDRGLTQQNVADELEVNISTVIRWEQGTTKINSERLEEIAKVFDLDISDLYNYKSTPDLLNPLGFYQKRKVVEITVHLDGTAATLNDWIATLRKINAALE